MKVYKSFFIILTLISLLYANETDTKKFNYGFLVSYDILADFKDARQSLKTYLETIGEKTGFIINLNFYEDSQKVSDDFKSGKLDLASMSYTHYYENKEDLEPIVGRYWSVSFNDDKSYKYCLVARSDIKFDSYKDLKNKSIIMKEYERNGSVWLDYKSLQTNNKKFKDVLKTIKYESKESTSLLSVFFKKYDLGLIRKDTWDTMLELNPAITKNVKLYECSKIDFLPFISVFRNQVDKEKSDIFYKATTNSSDKDMQGIFDLFNFVEVYELKKDDFKVLDDFYKRYYELKNKNEK